MSKPQSETRKNMFSLSRYLRKQAERKATKLVHREEKRQAKAEAAGKKLAHDHEHHHNHDHEHEHHEDEVLEVHEESTE